MSQVKYYYYACSPRKDTRYTLRFLKISLINILYIKKAKKGILSHATCTYYAKQAFLNHPNKNIQTYVYIMIIYY